MNITTDWIDKPWSIRAEINNIRKEAGQEIILSLPVEKVPLSKIEFGDRIAADTVVDKGIYFKSLTKRGKELKSISSISDKIDNILQYLNKILSYPYHSNLQQESNFEQLNEFYHNNPSNLPLSECIKYGYGLCAQFGILFAIVAQASDLKVTYNQVAKKTLKNIKRPDTERPLFQSVSLGTVDEHHVYNSVLVEGEYIPVDPTPNLNGMHDTHRKIFEAADYKEYKSLFVDEEDVKNYFGSSNCIFNPYQRKTELQIKIEPRSLGGTQKPNWPSRVAFELVPWMTPNPVKILSKELKVIH